MKILITGIAGFIGSHTGEKLLDMGSSIVGVDNFDSFYPKKFKLKNIENLSNSGNFSLYETDIRDKVALDDIFKNHKIDVVIHLAAKAGVRPSINNVRDYYDVNVLGTLNLLEVMRAHDVKNLLFASSSSVYGNNTKVPFSESDIVDNPISPYAATKKSGELLCHVYSHLYGFNINCLRFFTVFGPRQRPDLAIHKFIRNIDLGEQIPFYGDGNTARDYTYVADIVQGIICALNGLNGYNIFNLGEARVIQLNKLIEVIENTLGKKAVLNKQPLQPGDVEKTYADIDKARTILGYNPKYSLEAGIQEFVNWYNDNKSHLYNND